MPNSLHDLIENDLLSYVYDFLELNIKIFKPIKSKLKKFFHPILINDTNIQILIYLRVFMH
jgi:hypothetical protein